MTEVDKKSLSEQDICSKYVLPSIVKAGWDLQNQIREQMTFTAGRIIVKGKIAAMGEKKRADFIIYHKNNFPIAIIEAKDNNHSIGSGMQQALNYAETLDIPFVYSTNGDAFLEHNKLSQGEQKETEISMDSFPSPNELYNRYIKARGVSEEQKAIIEEEYHQEIGGRSPRYFQQIAINRTVEAIAKGQNRILLVMATGTGKTYVASQIIHKLLKSKTKKRVLFLTDRDVLLTQPSNNDFKIFKKFMTRITNRKVDTSYEVYLALYQAVTGNEDWKNIYKQFSREERRV